MVMWQKLLAERFGVVLHHESKEFQIEELVIDKSGSKVKETNWDAASPLPPGPPQRDNNGGLASPGQVVMIHPRRKRNELPYSREGPADLAIDGHVRKRAQLSGPG